MSSLRPAGWVVYEHLPFCAKLSDENELEDLWNLWSNEGPAVAENRCSDKALSLERKEENKMSLIFNTCLGCWIKVGSWKMFLLKSLWFPGIVLLCSH